MKQMEIMGLYSTNDNEPNVVSLRENRVAVLVKRIFCEEIEFQSEPNLSLNFNCTSTVIEAKFSGF